MSDIVELEKEALNLPPKERERLALAVWESLEGSLAIDPEGIEIALRRDTEVESGAVQTISHSEFKRLTRSNE